MPVFFRRFKSEWLSSATAMTSEKSSRKLVELHVHTPRHFRRDLPGYPPERVDPPEETAPRQPFVHLHDHFPQTRTVRSAEVEARIGHDGADIAQMVGEPLQLAKDDPEVAGFFPRRDVRLNDSSARQKASEWL